MIVPMSVFQKPRRLGIAMFIHNIGSQFTKFRPEKFEALIARIRTSGPYQRQVGVFFLKPFGKGREMLDVLWAPLFIADAHHSEMEWFRMTKGNSLGSPFAGHRPIGKLHQIESIL